MSQARCSVYLALELPIQLVIAFGLGSPSDNSPRHSLGSDKSQVGQVPRLRVNTSGAILESGYD
ncbi:hypothetical protein, partial [Limnobacter sp.]|uniref:hypothetical protein n=1 Tax=Limnobacter sp. TaxID=2003368 RepID=UPI0025889F45